MYGGWEGGDARSVGLVGPKKILGHRKKIFGWRKKWGGGCKMDPVPRSSWTGAMYLESISMGWGFEDLRSIATKCVNSEVRTPSDGRDPTALRLPWKLLIFSVQKLYFWIRSGGRNQKSCSRSWVATAFHELFGDTSYACYGLGNSIFAKNCSTSIVVIIVQVLKCLQSTELGHTYGIVR